MPVILALVPAFEQRIGQRVIEGNDTAGALEHGFVGGKRFDHAILPTGIVDALAAKG